LEWQDLRERGVHEKPQEAVRPKNPKTPPAVWDRVRRVLLQKEDCKYQNNHRETAGGQDANFLTKQSNKKNLACKNKDSTLFRALGVDKISSQKRRDYKNLTDWCDPLSQL